MQKTVNINRPTIGYLSRNATEAYELECQSGVIAAAQDCDINLLCFIGGALEDRQCHLHERNKIYKWVNRKNIDGLLVSTATLGHIVDYDRLRAFMLKYQPLPLISLGIPMTEIPSLVVDNKKGIYELMLHLIQDHHAKRIAFIKGPRDNYEAINRLKGYQEALAFCNIPLDRNLILEGNYLRDSGRKAVVQLLDQLKVPFDAIVAANDNMALYAMKELQERGFSIPKDVIIAGFDDLDEASSVNPGLTTVKQPVFEMGYQGVLEMLKILEGKPVQPEIKLPTSLIIRDSCGCVDLLDFSLDDGSVLPSSDPSETREDENHQDDLLHRVHDSLADENLLEQTKTSNQEIWLKELVDSIRNEIEGEEIAKSLSLLRVQILKSLEKGVDLSVWQRLVTAIVQVFYGIYLNSDDRYRVDLFFKKALVLIGKTGERFQKNNRIREREVFYALSRINEGLNESLKKADLKRLFSTELWIIGVKSCYIALYNNDKDCRTSKLYLFFDNESNLLPGNNEYPTEELIPGSFNTKTERFQFIVVPLVSNEDQLGFIILDVANTSINQYEALADQLARALKREDMDRQIRDYSAQLEKKVEERTTDLNHMIFQLREATIESERLAKEANAASDAKSNFLANMSHEIRTPMNGILGMLDLLMETKLDREQQEYSGIIQDSAESLMVIINDILDFSKIEAGKIEFESIDFDLRMTVKRVSELLSIKAADKNLELINVVNSDVPVYLKGDPGRLKQVLINLANNAIKFTEAGEVVIQVILERKTDSKALIRFEVIDTGIGISEIDKKHLFKSFSQIDVSVTRKYGGTGLGLAISKQLVQIMGGEIGVESEVGKGSTFWFTAGFELQKKKSLKKLLSKAGLNGKRIIVIDHNKTDRQVFVEYLKTCDCILETAGNCAEALNKLEAAAEANQPFEIALLDMNMPMMDGERFGRNIKDHPKLKDTILVMLSSTGNRGDAARVKEIGFAAYLPKPIKKRQLIDCLLMVLEYENGKQNHNSKPPLITQYSIKELQREVLVLLVEDNKVNQKLAIKVLEKMNYRVDVANNGKQAIAALAQTNYDVVLMDLQMPEMGGLEATKAIRDQSSPVLNHNVPIIAMTAHVKEGDKTNCMEAGMNGFVSKPFKRDLLFEEIDRLVNS